MYDAFFGKDKKEIDFVIVWSRGHISKSIYRAIHLHAEKRREEGVFRWVPVSFVC